MDLPLRPALFRTTSNYGVPEVQQIENYLYFGEPVPSDETVVKYFDILKAQVPDGYLFPRAIQARWNRLEKMIKTRA